MRFAVLGAGAIGAYLGAALAQAGSDVTLIARGPHLRAMIEHGVRVRALAATSPATRQPPPTSTRWPTPT